MAKTGHPRKVKLMMGLLYAPGQSLSMVQNRLEEAFGRLDFVSPLADWTHSRYYEEEMGTGLTRQFIAFERPILESDLPRIKNWCMTLEQDYAVDGSRRINIDPGTISLAALVLATTKSSGHRIYMGDGVYGELTLFFHMGRFTGMYWTYPDYLANVGIMAEIREIWHRQCLRADEANAKD